MHYRRCAQYQHMVVEQHGYYQYPVNDLQTYYSSSDHQEEENDHTEDEMPSETSGDQSPNTDMFRLAFAASQSSKLVVNAGELFNKLMSPKTLLANETNMIKNQIEHWLCMKQEYEECIAADDSGSLQDYNENTRRSLERIEEVTETDEKTDESNTCTNFQNKNKNCSDSESEAFDEEEQSDTESEHADFLDKLDECMKKFKYDTDKIIDLKTNDFPRLKDLSPVPKVNYEHDFTSITKPTSIRNQFSRRTSILPYSELSNELATFQKENCNIHQSLKDHYTVNSLLNLDLNKKVEGKENFGEETSQAIIKVQDISTDQKMNALEIFTIDQRKKELQLKKIQTCLDFTYKQIDELKNMIKVKEQFLKDMLQRCEARNSAKDELQKKRSKFKEKYNNAKRMLELSKLSKDGVDESTYNQQIKKYENLIMHYEKKMKDTKIIKQFAGDSVKTIVYVENLLAVSKKQMEELKCRFIKEEECKKLLENEIMATQKKIEELEEKYNVTNLKIKDIINDGESERYRLDLNIKYKDRQFPNLDHLFKKKQVHRINISDKKEILRHDIINLRYIRDNLIDRKYQFLSGQILMTPENQRELSLISEYVEVIDAIIEQKNVMICENESHRHSEQLILNQFGNLAELNYTELVILFDKYFYKVIDLEDSTKSLEVQNNTLIETLMKQRESELKLIKHQKTYERNIDNFVLNHYAEETSSSSYDNRIESNKDFENLFKENQVLRQQLAYFQSLIKDSATTHAISSNSIKTTNRVLNPGLMQIALKHKTTNVRREGNKLIFETNKKDK